MSMPPEPVNPAGQTTNSVHGALYRADGTTQLNASNVSEVYTAVEPTDPPVTINENLYEDRVPDGTVYPANERILKFYAGQVVPTSTVTDVFMPAVIGMVSPAVGPAAGGTTVTITGSGFTAGTTVSIGGDAATSVTVISPSRLTCVTPAHATGAVNVAVTNDSGATTATNVFTYQ